MRFVRNWLVLVLLFLALPGRSSSWQRDPLLSQLLVKQMVTDSTGYRWVATDEGVFRYDGYELVPLRKLLRPGSDPAPDPLTLTLLLDPAGNLWFGTERGLFRFQPRRGLLRRIALPQRPDKSENRSVEALFLHPRSGQLWISHDSGMLLVIDPLHPERCSGPDRYVGANVKYIQADGSPAGVWLSLAQANWPARRVYAGDSPPGAVQLAPTGPPLRRITGSCFLVPVPGTAPLRLFSASALFEVGAGRLREVRRWLPPGEEDNFTPLNDSPDSLREWASQGYQIQLTVRGPRTGRVVLDTLQLGSSPATHRHSHVLDHDPLGVQWCYSQFWRGCYKQSPPRRRVVQPLRLANGRPTPSTRAIARLPDGRLLLGAYGGLLAQAADSPQAPMRPLVVRQAGEPRLVLGYDLLVTRAGQVLVAESTRGFARFDPHASVLTALPFAADERFVPSHVDALLEDRAGRVWGGTQAGLFRVLPAPGRVVRYAAGPGVPPLPRFEIVDLAEDPASGELWLATRQGLYVLNVATGAWWPVGAADQPGRPLPTDNLICVAAAGPGRAWVGTATDGLLLVDAHAGLVQQLDLAEGLPSHVVATVLRRPDGTVWAGTYAGLVRYEPTAQRLAVLTEAEGLTDAEMNRNSAYADPLTGDLWFGGVGGLHRIRPGAINDEAPHRRPTRLLLTAVAEPALPGVGDAGEVVQLLAGGQLPHLQLGAGPAAFVELRLALTNYVSPDLTRYAYRLRRAGEAGVSPWLPTTRRLVLRGLPFGDYVVEVRAETVTGQLAANIVRVPLHVARVWWQHPLAWLPGAGLLVALAYGLFWLQGRRARREARLREELAANLHDEVGALLTRINFQAQLLREQHRQPVASDPDATAGFDRLLHNSQMAVQTMRDVVWSIDANADSVGALLDRMRDQLDQLGDSTGLAMQLHTAGLPDKLALPPALRQQLYLIFKEALTNAVRHAAGATTIDVRFTRADGTTELEVVDDGAYTAPAPPRRRPASGLGLRNMTHRAQAIGAELQTGARPDGQPGYRVWVRVRW